MKTPANANALTDPALAAARSDEEWVALHVPRFSEMRSEFEKMEESVKAVLKEACKTLAPLGIVETRTKKIPSFAEKILRKRGKYQDPQIALPPDPLVRLGDLCGGRVITQTVEQMQAICRFIEANFEIDWPESEDVGRRLQAREFGYLSFHYTVSFKDGGLAGSGIPVNVPVELCQPVKAPGSDAAFKLKAEIQVRTLLQHTWSDIGHDMTYKTEFKVPPHLERQAAALAAILENADREFSRLIADFDEYKSNIGAYLPAGALEGEIRKLRIVLQHDHENTSLAARIAQLECTADQPGRAIELLHAYAGRADFSIQRALGLALCEAHRTQPTRSEFLAGRDLLTEAGRSPQCDADTWCALAEAWRHEDEEQTRKHLQRAVALDPSDPVALCQHLEFEISHQRNLTVLGLVRSMIDEAMERCRKRIAANADLPRSYACLGVLHLLSGQPYEALAALAGAVKLCASGGTLDRALRLINRLRCVEADLPGWEWSRRMLLVGLATRDCGARAAAWAELQRLKSPLADTLAAAADRRVLFFVGGCAAEVQAQIRDFAADVSRGLAGLELTLLSGGTAIGMPAVAGDVAQNSAGRVTAFGYLPQFLPANARPDADKSRYARLICTTGHGFSPLEALQAWTDLVAAGIKPAQAKVVGILGGRISQAEYRIALALGAQVGIIEGISTPRDRVFETPAWAAHPGPVRLPGDAMTLRAFVLVGSLSLSEEEKSRLEPAARLVHENYRQSTQSIDAAHEPWEKLAPSLQLSNFQQVAYWEKVLAAHGLGVRPLTEADLARPPLKMAEIIGEDGILTLAEMEHGRWNVERIANGWRHAPKKDIAAQLSPWLIPWKDVPPEIQQYDIQAIRDLPGALRKANLELCQR